MQEVLFERPDTRQLGVGWCRFAVGSERGALLPSSFGRRPAGGRTAPAESARLLAPRPRGPAHGASGCRWSPGRGRSPGIRLSVTSLPAYDSVTRSRASMRLPSAWRIHDLPERIGLGVGVARIGGNPALTMYGADALTTATITCGECVPRD